MNVNDIESLGLIPATLENHSIDTTRLIVSDEFNRKRRTDASDYRERAIDRIVANNMYFHNECNITSNMAKRYLRATCPYCGEEMKTHGGGGSGSHSSIAFSCECGAKGSIRVANEAFSFSPPEKDEEK